MPAPTPPCNAQPLDLRSHSWALLFLVSVLLSLPARSQALDFTRDCMRVAVEGLILNTSPACVGAFRSDPAARTQFVQVIEITLALAESAQRDPRASSTPAQSLRRLFDKASLESGRVVGVGGIYYGAQ
ncbi:MAG: hypothetical protein Q8M80_11275 [Hydrogenophaga sp.]|jgi:hypothetical protein|uniref:hypothetical protein n=1 Tax=Hydrogenophaga sp. TaxID=1904254 RepID=UPI0025C4ADB0|nr:hypothetical protein [Hydrogenophaga sp.]MDO8889738.1 hypothetical protein [Hydrogenophaga sp.]MDO9504321.1 hypothetical protein [Hydrogenophaga sp.]MDP1782182.1 hypothetical protein [Hydrogenophaga sp.]MDP2251914.1 hypothetical protein [Hydrogenophaga sp.]MDP2987455.1 hypothetical protein [Hydrogenophaga sp.]